MSSWDSVLLLMSINYWDYHLLSHRPELTWSNTEPSPQVQRRLLNSIKIVIRTFTNQTICGFQSYLFQVPTLRSNPHSSNMLGSKVSVTTNTWTSPLFLTIYNTEITRPDNSSNISLLINLPTYKGIKSFKHIVLQRTVDWHWPINKQLTWQIGQSKL